ETFLGYPLRIFTAQLVGDGLAAAGYASIGVDTILIFENGISKVDLPCSGVQSLWAGTLFFLAATWLEEKKIGFRWLLSIGVFGLLLIGVNTLRVAILVTVGEALGFHFAAELLHIPLGILGFVAACAVAMAMLRYFVPRNNQSEEPVTIYKPSSSTITNPLNRAVLLILLFLFAVWVYTAKPVIGLNAEVESPTFPENLELIHEPLKPDEAAWLIEDGAEWAERYRFTWQSADGPRTGTMILISSRTWRAHHKPERCFEVYGLDVNDSGTHLVTPSMPIRQVNLAVPQGEQSYRAVYWFQSADTITDDYGSRLWADVTQPNTRWMLVSVLFDENYPADDAGTESFYLAMQTAVETHLE
ncbi:MAG: exosortase O, partial [Chloroflexota bacterium]